MSTLRRVVIPEGSERRPIQEEMNDPDWEPPESERTWYRNAQTGDRGYLCRRDGKQMIRLDRPQDPSAISQFSESLWHIDRESRPLTEMQTTQVAYEADQALCKALGLYAKTKDWISQPEPMRIAWKRKGPQKPEVRAKLYKAIRAALKELEG